MKLAAVVGAFSIICASICYGGSGSVGVIPNMGHPLIEVAAGPTPGLALVIESVPDVPADSAGSSLPTFSRTCYTLVRGTTGEVYSSYKRGQGPDPKDILSFSCTKS